MNKPGIIIVGGGACGLMAAKILSSSHQVTLLEQEDKLGGRIRTLRSGNNIIEAGAEFMHGVLPLTVALLKKAGLHYSKAEGKMVRKDGFDLRQEEERVVSWDDFFEKIETEAEDITLDHFLDKHFGGNEQEGFRKEVKQYAMGFDLADPKHASAFSLCREWLQDESNYRILEGYGALIDFMEKECVDNGCEIVCNETVVKITCANKEVEIITASGKKFYANKTLVTIPANILFDTVQFNTPLESYITASKQIGFGSAIKIVIELKSTLWETGVAFIFSEEAIPTWWTPFPSTGNLLTGWAGGPMADKIGNFTNDELELLALKCVAQIFNLSLDALKSLVSSVHVFNWNKGSAYSYATLESKKARSILNTPIDNTIFLAGEALYDGPHSGTVEAAFSSASLVCLKILSSQDW